MNLIMLSLQIRLLYRVTDLCMLMDTFLCFLVFTQIAFSAPMNVNFKFYSTNNGQNLIIDSLILDANLSRVIFKIWVHSALTGSTYLQIVKKE